MWIPRRETHKNRNLFHFGGKQAAKRCYKIKKESVRNKSGNYKRRYTTYKFRNNVFERNPENIVDRYPSKETFKIVRIPSQFSHSYRSFPRNLTFGNLPTLGVPNFFGAWAHMRGGRGHIVSIGAIQTEYRSKHAPLLENCFGGSSCVIGKVANPNWIVTERRVQKFVVLIWCQHFCSSEVTGFVETHLAQPQAIQFCCVSWALPPDWICPNNYRCRDIKNLDEIMLILICIEKDRSILQLVHVLVFFCIPVQLHWI